MLVVGPSGVFMRYIERVLPSLGETAVALRSLGEVVDGLRATRHDEPAVADIKGSARMADPAAAGGAAAGARQPGPVPRLLARRRAHPRARHARPGPPPADVAGPAQPPAAPGGRRPARRAVEPGPRRARPRPGPGGVRRRPARRRRRSSTSWSSWWPPLDARDRARLAARPRPARPGLRRPAQPRGAAAADQVLGQRRRGRPVRRGRAADRRAALRARRRARSAPTTSATSTRPPCWRAASTCRSC